MKKKERSYLMYLLDIQTAMLRIEEYIQGLSYSSFVKDYKTVDAVIRNFEVIGEASKNLPDSIKERYPEIPWSEMYLLRNKVSHEYFGIDYEIIWDIAFNYLPSNKLYIDSVIDKVSAKR